MRKKYNKEICYNNPELVTYKWAKVGNKYTIFQVPIFKTYDGGREDLPKVTEEDLQQIVANFEEDKKKSFLPRTHISHHAQGSTINNPGCGFIDNLTIKGDTLYADLIEIPEEHFKKIQDGTFPYRSVELCYNDDKRVISSLALLESRQSFFKFPILKVATANYQALYQGECMDTKEPEKKEEMKKGKFEDSAKEDEKKEADYEDGAEESKPEGESPEHESAEMGMLKQMQATLSAIMAMIQKMAPAPAPAPAVPAPETPGAGSVAPMQAYQNPALFQEVAALKKELRQLKKGQESKEIWEQLAAYAEVNSNISFENEKAYMETLPTKADKERHLNYLKSARATNFSHSANTLLRTATASLDKVTAQYASKPHLMEWSKKLASAWEDGISDRRFAKTWPDQEKFVSFFCEQENLEPGYIKKTLFS